MKKTIAILATNGFEQSELFSPKEAMEREGFDVQIISLEKGKIKGWDQDNWGKEIEIRIDQIAAALFTI